jgi:hypothetical protein
MSIELTEEQERYIDHILNGVLPRIRKLDNPSLEKAVAETKALLSDDRWKNFIDVQHRTYGWPYAEHLALAFYLEHNQGHASYSPETVANLRLGRYIETSTEIEGKFSLDELGAAPDLINEL